MSADLPAILDQLDEARAKATPGEWAQHPSDDEYVIGDVSDDGMSYADVGDTYAFRKREGSADAALIVAAVNALPKLTAAIRAVLDECDAVVADDSLVHNDETRANRATARRIRATLTAALTPEATS